MRELIGKFICYVLTVVDFFVKILLPNGNKYKMYLTDNRAFVSIFTGQMTVYICTKDSLKATQKFRLTFRIS